MTQETEMDREDKLVIILYAYLRGDALNNPIAKILSQRIRYPFLIFFAFLTSIFLRRVQLV